MPSSTSSFDRAIPNQRWLRMAPLVLVLVSTLVVGWEWLARSRGFEAALDDTPDLWAHVRDRLDHAPPDQVVLIGSSRMLFDMDVEEFARGDGGRRPLELAEVGTNELFMLENLAADPHFRGTAIVSFVPGLTFLPAQAATRRIRKAVERYEHGSIAQWLSARMWEWFDERLAFLNGDELTLRKLIEQVDVPQRAGVDALFLPALQGVDRERRGRMYDRVLADPALRAQTEAVWLDKDPPPGNTPAEIAANVEATREQVLWRERAAVAKIRARGGRVIYIRFPSSGGVLAAENARYPRALTWDALLAVTGAPGIHFEDYPQLASFSCPEWSHLSATDSAEFTRRLMPLLRPHLR